MADLQQHLYQQNLNGGEETTMRQGFTILELLACAAIITILAALIAPAVMSAREHSRGLQCINNLKQITLAIQTYDASYQHGPPARDLPRALSAHLEYQIPASHVAPRVFQ